MKPLTAPVAMFARIDTGVMEPLGARHRSSVGKAHGGARQTEIIGKVGGCCEALGQSHRAEPLPAADPHTP